MPRNIAALVTASLVFSALTPVAGANTIAVLGSGLFQRRSRSCRSRTRSWSTKAERKLYLMSNGAALQYRSRSRSACALKEHKQFEGDFPHAGVAIA